MPSPTTVEQLVNDNVPEVRAKAVQAHAHLGAPGVRQFAVPSFIPAAVVENAVRMAVDLAVQHFGTSLEALVQTQKAAIDAYVSDAALEAISGAIKRLESVPKA